MAARSVSPLRVLVVAGRYNRMPLSLSWASAMSVRHVLSSDAFLRVVMLTFAAGVVVGFWFGLKF